MKIRWAAAFCAVAFLTMAVRGQVPAEPSAAAFPQFSGAAGWRPDASTHRTLSDDWRFHRGNVEGAAQPTFDDHSEAWAQVTVPHTWNGIDGQDGGNNYFKGESWYRRHISVDAAMAAKSLYLRFEAVNRKADVYINGTLVGTHTGGQGAFCFDVSDALKAGDNVLAVKVSNANDAESPPLQADFTFYGGIYRPVELLVLDKLHISPMDYASPGVYVTTPEVTANSANVSVRVHVDNRGSAAKDKKVVAVVEDAEGRIVTSVTQSIVSLENSQSEEKTFELLLPRPHLWNGLSDPYLYSVQVHLLGSPAELEMTHDVVTQPLAVRTFSVDTVKGFMLNGQPYDVRGVNRHQDRPDKGWALSAADHLEDIALIKEMGCTAVRLAHYQHADYFYGLCDRAGIVVWAEIPVVDKLAAPANLAAFTKNAQQQYVELIRQNMNHPSICFWSAGNEVDPPVAPQAGRAARGPAAPDVYGWFREMNSVAHKEDASRLSASAWRERFFPPADMTDVFGLNEYLGWYTGGPGGTNGWEGLETYIARHSEGAVKGKWAVTEYGAGSSVYFHSEKPVRMDHTEEYQCLLHENTWAVLKKHPEIWGKFIWNMFDFAVDGRAEGDHAGRNDKGMVTYDRTTKKDAFYFYKAAWSQEPTLWLTSKRFTVRGLEKIPVKVYTNATRATLAVNGQTLGEKASDNGTILWEGVALKEGKNEVIASAVMPDGKKSEDRCTWTYTPGAPREVYEAQDDRMREALRARAAAGAVVEQGDPR